MGRKKEVGEWAITDDVRQLCKRLKAEHHPHFFYWKISDRFTAAIPDWFISYRGRCLFLELKRPGEEPSDLQLAVMRQLMLAGHKAIWTDDYTVARGAIKSLIPNR